VGVYKFLEKKKLRIHSLARALFGHGVNYNLTEITKLNLFK